MSIAVLGVLLCSALWPGKAPEGPQPYPGFNDLDLTQVSQCVPWGMPLRGGPVKALFIAPRFTLRDAVELSERLEMDVATVPLWDAHHLGAVPIEGSPLPAGTSSEEALKRLSQQLDGRDVILAGNFDFTIIPDDHWKAILDKVRSGKGLVLAAYGNEPLPPVLQEALDGLEPEEAKPITRGVGEGLTPEWSRGLTFVSAGKLGDGRVVQLNYGGERPHSHCLAPPLSRPMEAEPEYFDVYMSLVAKATLWAARRETGFWITGIEAAGPPAPTDAEIPPIFPDEYVEQMRDSTVRQPYNPYNVLFNKPSDDTYDVRVQVRQPGRNRFALYERPLKLRKGDESYPVALDLGTGKHYVDTWLLDKGRVVDWHTSVVEVAGWPKFENLQLSKSTVLPNDGLDVSFDIPPPMSEQIYEQRGLGCGVMLRAVDSLKRVVATSMRHVPPSGGHVQMSLTFADLAARRLKIEVFVLETPPFLVTETREFSEAELSRAVYDYRYILVKPVTAGLDFSLICAAEATPEYNVRNALLRLSQAGVDMLCADGEWGGYYAGEANLQFVPHLTSYHPSAGDGYQEVPCLTDPTFLRSEGLDLENALKTQWIGGSSFYSLGSGNRLVADDGHFCRSETCLAGFRGRLAASYGTIDALNSSWGTSLASFEAASPPTVEETKASGRFAPWIDFRQYMDTVFTSIHTFARDLVKVQEPQARTGFTEAEDSDLYAGYDWQQLATELDVLAARPNLLSMEKVRSYRRPGTITGIVYNGHHPENGAYAPWLPWAALIHGMPTLWYDGPSCGAEGASIDGTLTPDGRLVPAFSALLTEVAEIEGGLARILLNAEREPASVAIYDGTASAYLAAVDPEFGEVAKAQATVATVLGDLAFGYDFVSPAQMTNEGLKPYKVLVLPLVRALSDREIETVLAFRESGGSVIADIAPGQYNEHGVARETPPLGPMFGAQWTAAPKPSEPVPAQIEAGGRVLSSVTVDSTLAATEATPGGTAGATSVLLEKKGENGLALLTNIATPAYETLTGDDIRTWRSLLRDVLTEAGVTPIVDAKGDNSAVLSGKIAAFRHGATRIVLLLRDPDRGDDIEKLDLPFDQKAVVYNLRTGERLSRPKKNALRLARGGAAAYAVLPYDVTAMELEVPPSVYPGKRLPIHVALHTKGGLPGEHVIRFDFGPYPGGPLAHYGLNASCKDGRLDTYIPLGQRERAGLYRVTAYDVLTGTFAESMVKVETDEPDVDASPGKR